MTNAILEAVRAEIDRCEHCRHLREIERLAAALPTPTKRPLAAVPAPATVPPAVLAPVPTVSQADVLAFIAAQSKPVARREIADALGARPDRITEKLTALRRSGKIDSEDTPCFAPTVMGRIVALVEEEQAISLGDVASVLSLEPEDVRFACTEAATAGLVELDGEIVGTRA